MLTVLAKAATGVLASIAILLALMSYGDCSSSYADDELQSLFDPDDAFLVEFEAAFVIIFAGAALALCHVRRSRRWLLPCAMLAFALAALSQIILLETRQMCVCLPGIVDDDLPVMTIEPGM